MEYHSTAYCISQDITMYRMVQMNDMDLRPFRLCFNHGGLIIMERVISPQLAPVLEIHRGRF